MNLGTRRKLRKKVSNSNGVNFNQFSTNLKADNCEVSNSNGVNFNPTALAQTLHFYLVSNSNGVNFNHMPYNQGQ